MRNVQQPASAARKVTWVTLDVSPSAAPRCVVMGAGATGRTYDHPEEGAAVTTAASPGVTDSDAVL